MVTPAQLREIIRQIVNGYDPEAIYLFGAYATGEHIGSQDVDLVIVKATPEPRLTRGREVRRCLRGIKTPVNILVYTREEIRRWEEVPSSFIGTVMETGVKVYEK